MNLHFRQLKQNGVLMLYMLMVFLLPLLYIEPLHNPSSLPRYALVALTAGLILMLFSLSMWRKQIQLRWHPSQLLAIAILLFASLSYAWSIEAENSLIEIMSLTSLVIIFLVATQINSISHIQYIVFVAVVSGGLAALIGILQNFGFNPIQFRSYVMASTFVYKNHAALYFDLIIPVSFFLIFAAENKFVKWSSAVCFGLCIGFIFESRTRGSYLSLAIVFIIIILIYLFNSTFREKLTQKIKQNYFIVLLGIIVCLLAIIPPGKNDADWERPRAKTLTASNGLIQSVQKNIDQSSSDRLLFYRNSLGIIQENPILGTGYGTFWKSFRKHMNRPYVIHRSNETLYLMRLHSDVLQFFTELGLLGGLLFMLFFVTIIVTGVRLLFKESSNDNQLFIMTGLLLAIVASLIHAIVDFPFHKPASATMIWLWSGLLIAYSIKLSVSDTKIQKNRAVSSALIIFASVYLIFNFFFYSAYFRGNHYFYLAEQNIKSKDCSNAISNIDKAISSFGLYHITHLERVNIHIGCNKVPQNLFNVLSEELQRDNTNIRALLTRAELFLANGYLKQAEQDYKQVIFILPHRVSGKIGLIKVMLKAGETDKAIEQLRTILHEHPENKDARKILEEIINMNNQKSNNK